MKALITRSHTPLLTQTKRTKEERPRSLSRYCPLGVQTLFGSYVAQSCQATALVLVVQVPAVRFPVTATANTETTHVPGKKKNGTLVMNHVNEHVVVHRVSKKHDNVIGTGTQRTARTDFAIAVLREKKLGDETEITVLQNAVARLAIVAGLLPDTNFTVCRKNMREFREWMTSSLKPSEARQLRESFIPNFANSSFQLKGLQLNSSIVRRFKDPNLRGPDLTKAEASEKSHKAEQYKVLDVARPLLFLQEKMS
ncbi:hypothetical protein GHT06_018465 [Daphnia sinensis]|uniref:Uncharacterized protein n=1 Tax=Daphnia sinensis TaxID=1820382 RepID=A0AAD5PSA7_9CRUS|nr:hypothetical protein GHT06_018465 [Daphnia sinensis]